MCNGNTVCVRLLLSYYLKQAIQPGRARIMGHRVAGVVYAQVLAVRGLGGGGGGRLPAHNQGTQARLHSLQQQVGK